MEQNLKIIFGLNETSSYNKIYNLLRQYDDRVNVFEKNIHELPTDKKNIYFSSDLDGCKNLLPKCRSIFFIFLSEQSAFENSVLNRTYLWRSHHKKAKELLDYLKTQSLERKLFIINGENQNSLDELCRAILDDEPVDSRFLLDYGTVYEELQKPAPIRKNGFIFKTFHEYRKQMNKECKMVVRKWIDALLNSNNMEKRNETIDEILEIFDSKRKVSKEEKHQYKKLICDYRYQDKIAFKLFVEEVNTICKIIQPLNRENITTEDADLLRRLLGLVDVLRSVSEIEIFQIYTLKDNSVLEMVTQMLQSENKLVKYKATELIVSIISRDPKTLNRKLMEQEVSDESQTRFSIYQTVYELIYSSCEEAFSTSDINTLSQLSSIYKQLNINCFELMLLGSPENCDRFSVHLENLIKLLNKGIDSFLKSYHSLQLIFLCDLLSILNTMLKYGKLDVWQKVNHGHLLSISAVLLKESIRILGPCSQKWLKKAAQFYNSMLVLAERFYFKEPEENSAYYNVSETNNIEIEIETNRDTVESEALKSIINSYQKYTALNESNTNNKINDFMFTKQDKAKLLQTQYDLQHKITEHDEQIKKYDQKIEENKITLEEYKNQLCEYEIAKQEVILQNEKLRLQNAKMKSEYENSFLRRNEPIENIANDTISHEENSENIENDDSNNDSEIVINSKEDAKAYIEKINKKHKNIKEFRKWICGSLKNLSTDLYTSKAHFLSEIIQNVEDAEFDSKEATLKIIIEKDSILFCSNEIGFSAKDVKAICSLSDSNKLKGLNIGNKGLGFKSVFTCSNNPIIFSKPYWQFEFRKGERDDEIAYITPFYLNDDNIPEYLSRNINESYSTYIYLPFKDNLIYSHNTKSFYEMCTQVIDSLHLMLLFTKKLKQIVIEDNVSMQNKTLIQSQINNRTEIKANSDISSFKVFNKKIEIVDKSVIDEEELACNHIDISIAFPENSEKKLYGIYSFLPVENKSIRFPFLINSNWSLNTNREDIRHCLFNEILRDKLAEFFCEIVQSDTDLKQNILQFLPSQDKLNIWWRSFTNIIKNKLNEMELNTNGSVIKEKRFFNEDLQLKLNVPSDILSSVGIEIIESRDSALNQNDFEYYLNWKKLSIEDILRVFDKDNSSNEIEKWISERSIEWWRSFYYELYVSKIKADKNKYRIFLQRESMNEEESKLVYLDDNFNYFTCNERDIKMWRKENQIIDFRSEYEAKYLKEVLAIPEITIDSLINIIVQFHVKIAKCGIVENIWKDLDFVRKHIKKSKIDQSTLSCLLLPTKDGGLFPAKFVKMPSLLGYDLTNLPLLNDNEKIVNYRVIKAKCSFFENLEWEYFFIKIGMSLPDVDLNLLEDKIKANELREALTPFTQFNEKETRLALEITSEINSSHLLGLLPIQCSDSVIRKSSDVYWKNEFEEGLPNVNIPEYAIELAEMVKLNVSLNFKACLTALRNLVERQNRNITEYIKWFQKIGLYLAQLNDYEKEDILSMKLIFIDDADTFYSLREVYICDNSPLLEKICKYLRRTVIDKNSKYMQVEYILKCLGCKLKPTVEDIVETICMMTEDSDLFTSENQLSVLTSNGYEILQYFYFELENTLKDLANYHEKVGKNDWEKRLAIKNISEERFCNHFDALRKLPIITFDHQIVKHGNRVKKLVCSLCSEVNEQFDKQNSHLYYSGDAEIALNCPFIMAVLDCIYLEPLCAVKLTHLINNIEVYCPQINEIIREETGLDDLELLNVVYIGASVCYNSSLTPIRKDNIELNEFKIIYLDLVDYALFDKKWIVCSSKNSFDEKAWELYKESLTDVIKLSMPNASEQLINEKVDRIIERIKVVHCSDNMNTWENGAREDTVFNMDDVLFPKESFRSPNTVFFSKNNKNSNRKAKYQKFARTVNPDYVANDFAFQNRASEAIHDLPAINTIDNFPTTIERHTHDISMDHKRKELIGIAAEHLFYRVLECLYGSSFSMSSWVSSSKRKVFQNELPGNDMYGYDFNIKEDFQKKFSSHGKECFIEVKGCAGKWDGTFHLTENEKNKMYSTLRKNNLESYVIVIIENVENHKKIKIAAIINWTENKDMIYLNPEAYLAKVNRIEAYNDESNRDLNITRSSIQSSSDVNESNTEVSLRPCFNDKKIIPRNNDQWNKHNSRNYDRERNRQSYNNFDASKNKESDNWRSEMDRSNNAYSPNSGTCQSASPRSSLYNEDHISPSHMASNAFSNNKNNKRIENADDGDNDGFTEWQGKRGFKNQGKPQQKFNTWDKYKK